MATSNNKTTSPSSAALIAGGKGVESSVSPAVFIRLKTGEDIITKIYSDMVTLPNGQTVPSAFYNLVYPMRVFYVPTHTGLNIGLRDWVERYVATANVFKIPKEEVLVITKASEMMETLYNSFLAKNVGDAETDKKNVKILKDDEDEDEDNDDSSDVEDNDSPLEETDLYTQTYNLSEDKANTEPVITVKKIANSDKLEEMKNAEIVNNSFLMEKYMEGRYILPNTKVVN